VRLAPFGAFSDGVFAIAITLLVLDVAVPAASGDRLLHAVLEEWPSYIGYVVSFSTIGAVWIAHIAVNECLERVDSTLIRLNLVLLSSSRSCPFRRASSTSTCVSQARSG
jgi:uncharacterized membrane protein